ncbi:uncharacterized protein LOC142356499, partial [Convolutriloba macropyga]|uniref:uncharacterized protein LOC142356499 n=1 Tax=Convolutriloba macropyga TaxID=536237 RepID=UPI003F5216E5
RRKHGVPDTHDVIAEINEVEQTNEQIGLQKETTESIAESVDEIAEGEKRSIFAAPKWDPAKPATLLKIHRRLMKIPLVYSGIEKAIDVSESFKLRTETRVKFEPNPSCDRSKFAFRAPALIKKDPETGLESDFEEITEIPEEDESENEEKKEKESTCRNEQSLSSIPFDADQHAKEKFQKLEE